MVPKGRFELPRPYGHYALNVARLPVPPLRPDIHLSKEDYSTVHLSRQYELPWNEIDGTACMSPIRSLIPELRLSRPSYNIQLLGRPGCHLCDDALSALRPVFGRDMIEEIDITTAPELEELYVFRIPVVLFQDQVVSEGIIDRKEARLALKRVRQIASTKAGSA